MNRNAKAIALTASTISIGLLLIAMTITFSPKLVWNASQSAPLGLYFIKDRQPVLGEYALIRPSKTVAMFIEERGYLPPETLLIKRIVALPGDEICRKDLGIFINKIHVAEVQKADSLDREMPQWSGCFTLKTGEVFLLNDHEKSLDGRYFGATKLNDVVGVAVPLFVKGRA